VERRVGSLLRAVGTDELLSRRKRWGVSSIKIKVRLRIDKFLMVGAG
jgi:hypothetical protein